MKELLRLYKESNSVQKKVFNSISEASRALGISRDTIRKYNSKNNIKWKII